MSHQNPRGHGTAPTSASSVMGTRGSGQFCSTPRSAQMVTWEHCHPSQLRGSAAKLGRIQPSVI